MAGLWLGAQAGSPAGHKVAGGLLEHCRAARLTTRALRPDSKGSNNCLLIASGPQRTTVCCGCGGAGRGGGGGSCALIEFM